MHLYVQPPFWSAVVADSTEYSSTWNTNCHLTWSLIYIWFQAGIYAWSHWSSVWHCSLITQMFLTKCQIEFIKNVSLKSCLIEVQTMQWSHALLSVNNWSPKTVTHAMECKFGTRTRICRPFKEPRNRFPAWRAGTTTLFFVPARQAT